MPILFYLLVPATHSSLRRLISVHGRYSYMRMSNLIYYSFYKNLTFILVQLWFSIFSGWAGQVRAAGDKVLPGDSSGAVNAHRWAKVGRHTTRESGRVQRDRDDRL